MIVLIIVLISISIFEIADLKKNNYKKEIYVFLALVVIAFAAGSVYLLNLYTDSFSGAMLKLFELNK